MRSLYAEKVIKYDPTRVRVGLSQRDKIQMGLDKLFGLNAEDIQKFARMSRLDGQPLCDDLRAAQAQHFEDVPVPSGLREVYELLTGDADVSGRFYPARIPKDLRADMAITSTTFSYVLGNTLGRRLIKDYRLPDWREELLVSTRKPVKDFRQQEAVLIGYYPDLDDVDPESGDYQEIAGTADEESTYALGQKGNILTVTRKAIINDDLDLILRKESRLSRAARRTHAQYVWNFWINNATCSDGTAWFTSGHGNYTTSALSHSTANAAYIALAKMTEKDSGKRIGLVGDPNIKPILIYPVDLMATAEEILKQEYYYTSNDLTTKTGNPLFGKVEGAMISLLTDAADWGLLLPASAIDMVEMGYLNGREDPEFFVADQPGNELVLVADKIRYKLRHEYAGAPTDYRGAYKGVVP